MRREWNAPEDAEMLTEKHRCKPPERATGPRWRLDKEEVLQR